jgi:hypothetical protein
MTQAATCVGWLGGDSDGRGGTVISQLATDRHFPSATQFSSFQEVRFFP